MSFGDRDAESIKVEVPERMYLRRYSESCRARRCEKAFGEYLERIHCRFGILLAVRLQLAAVIERKFSQIVLVLGYKAIIGVERECVVVAVSSDTLRGSCQTPPDPFVPFFIRSCFCLHRRAHVAAFKPRRIQIPNQSGCLHAADLAFDFFLVEQTPSGPKTYALDRVTQSQVA